MVLGVLLAGMPTAGRGADSVRVEPATPGWQPLFDGRSLDGWRVECTEADRGRSFWSVADGAIVADSRGSREHGYVWLVSEAEFADFELRLEFQVERGITGNSGVQLRSRWNPDDTGGWLNGPQVDLAPGDPWRTGFVYDETRGVQRWLVPSRPDWRLEEAAAWPQGRPEGWRFRFAGGGDAHEEGGGGDGWNRLEIRCEGGRVATRLNGIGIVDWDGAGILDDAVHGEADVGRCGHLALQIHAGDEVRIRFRAIQLRELPEPEAAASGVAQEAPPRPEEGETEPRG